MQASRSLLTNVSRSQKENENDKEIERRTPTHKHTHTHTHTHQHWKGHHGAGTQEDRAQKLTDAGGLGFEGGLVLERVSSCECRV
jgi:hypothetical protein